MRISDWSSDVCSSDLLADDTLAAVLNLIPGACCPTATRSPWYVLIEVDLDSAEGPSAHERLETALAAAFTKGLIQDAAIAANEAQAEQFWRLRRSEEHTSELQSLMRNSYAVFCLKKITTLKYLKQNQYY